MRPRKLRSIVLAGMALLFCHLTLAQVQPNQRARKIERFEPREGTLRIAAIHAAWERTMSKLKAADPSKPCSEFPRERCVDGHFKPPFPAALKATDFPRGSNWKNPDRIRYLLEENRYSWAPIEMVAGGKELLQSYRRQAASGNLFGCEADERYYCNFITYSSSQPALLIACDAYEPTDPPDGCMALAFSEGGRDWLAIEAQEASGIGGPSDDFRIQFLTRENALEPRILAVMSEGLSSVPLSLHVITAGMSGLKGTSEYKVSQVLRGWRELAVVTVGVEREPCVEPVEERSQLQSYCLTYSSKLWVNKQNTDNPVDWHRPSPTQERAYELAIGQALRDGLKRLCPNASWKVENLVRCE